MSSNFPLLPRRLFAGSAVRDINVMFWVKLQFDTEVLTSHDCCLRFLPAFPWRRASCVGVGRFFPKEND